MCIIPNCITDNRTGSVLTCDVCLNNSSRNPDQTICYNPIEQCLQYTFYSPSGYACAQCAFPYQISSSGYLCLQGSYTISGFTGTTPSGSTNGYYYVLDSSQHLVWKPIQSTDVSNGYSVSFSLQSYTVGASVFYTLRTIVDIMDPVLMIMTPQAFYLTSDVNGVLSIQSGFSTDNNGNPSMNLRFLINRVFVDTNVFNIQSVLSGMYINYFGVESGSPTYFLFG